MSRPRHLVRTCIRAMQMLKEQSSRPPMPTFKPSAAAAAASSMATRVIRSEHPSASDQVRVISTPALEHRTNCVEAMQKRQAEKAENVMHLVCWGPK